MKVVEIKSPIGFLQVLLISVFIIIGFSCGVLTTKIKWNSAPLGDCTLCTAFQLAENEVDNHFGKQSFLHGFRRVLKDGERDSYAFQVKTCINGETTNLLVNVDLTGVRDVVNIDYKAGYSFERDFKF